MTAPLESNFLIPNGTFLISLLVLLLILGVLVGGVIWLVVGLSRRGQSAER